MLHWFPADMLITDEFWKILLNTHPERFPHFLKIPLFYVLTVFLFK
jgi:hypothetical protein